MAHLEALYSSRGAPILRSDFADELRFDRVTFCSRRLLVAVTGHGSAAVYRLYTLHGLGYVGISDNWVGRIPQHGAKPWAGEVIAAHVHNVESRTDAERLEVALIERHRPPFNLARAGVSTYLQALADLATQELEREAAR